MRLNKNSDLLLQLINDILDFSKIEASTFDIHPKKFDFKEICEEIYAVHTLKIRIMYASLSTGTYPPSNLTPIRNGSTGNLQFPDQCNQIHIQWRNQTGLPIERK